MTKGQLNILRRDPLSRKWVLYLSRYHDLEKVRSELLQAPQTRVSSEESARTCPLCKSDPGTEVIVDLVGDRFIYHNHGQATDWSIRVQPCLHPLFQIEESLDRRGERLYDTMKAQGAHELFILSRHHAQTIAMMGASDIRNILLTVRERMIDLHRDNNLGHLIFYTHYGEEAGSRFTHPYGHLIATPFVPEKVQRELRGAQEWYALKERCLFCDILNDEIDRVKDGKASQIIGQNDGYLAVIPLFGSFPFETWIIPREHNSEFTSVSSHHLLALAELVVSTLHQITKLLGDVALSLYLLTQPSRRWGQQRNYWLSVENDWHWRLLLVPRIPTLTRPYNDYFEGTGSRVNPILPEIAAELLKNL